MNPGFARTMGDFLASTVPDVSNPQTDRDRVIARMSDTFPTLVDEVAAVEPGLRQPMYVITAGEAWWGRPDVDQEWRRSHEAFVESRPRRHLIVADGSDHDVAEKRPELIVAAVEQLLAAISVTR
jgi:pimeloyl-ACP methyl ester carboxylesterase